MFDLNSLIVEGLGTEFVYADQERKLSFVLKSERVYKRPDGSEKRESLNIPCIMFGSAAETISKKIKRPECGVRIVGRIFNEEETGTIAIMVEHLDLKLARKTVENR